MAIEAYIPSEVAFNAAAVPDVWAITLHDPDGPGATGSMTTSHPLDAGATGELTFVARRDGREWRVTIGNVRVAHRTALGCEYTFAGPIIRAILRELGEAGGDRKKGLEERFDIR